MSDKQTIVQGIRKDTSVPERSRIGNDGDLFFTRRGFDINAIHSVRSNAGAAVAITLPAPGAGYCTRFDYIHFGYDDDPTGGMITVTDGITTQRIPVTQSGPGFLPFDTTRWYENRVVTITLAGGGGAIVGYITVHGVRAEAE